MSAAVALRRWLARLLAGDPLHTAAAVVLDVLVVALAYGVALLLRFESNVPGENARFTAQFVPAIAVVYVATNLAFGVYRTVWTYGSLGDIVGLARPVLLATVLVFGADFFVETRHVPLGVVLIAASLIYPGMCAVKMRSRMLARTSWGGSPSRRLLVVGAGRTGQLLARELQNSPELNYQPVGFVDDDRKTHHTRIHGLPVLGAIEDLAEFAVVRGADVVAIAVPGARGAAIGDIVAVCQQLDIPVRMVPGVESWIGGSHADALREITFEDLLGREPVSVDYEACAKSVRDRVILVTGAAGSIGSELCRQVLAFGPRELHLVDNNETGLFELASDLADLADDINLKCWVADISDGRRIDSVFERTRPNVVYHAAALKHVPLMEEHPEEAFRVNVLGTLSVARAARSSQAERFVLVSTDKAVRPSSVMGATKRMAELVIIALAVDSVRTEFVAVRFGNVMGSRGSVVPIFVRQIERGGPVTVMHPDMMRYFISIPEAVSLVIQAGTFGGRGTIYMLDMGDEVRILELAERMIRLRGLEPGRDIQVRFTGPRPGEKLREELVDASETREETEHPKVMRLTSTRSLSSSEMKRMVAEISNVIEDQEELRRRIHLVARRFSTGDVGEPVSGAGVLDQ